MKKSVKIILGIIFLILLLVVLKYFKDSNSKSIEDFKVEEPFYTSINSKVVATGKLNPEEEIELKPQISGIVDKIFVEEGDVVKKGDLIAKIRVVPNEQSMASAKSRIASSNLSYKNAETLYKRNKALFEKGVISQQDFENSELSFNQAKETLNQAQNDYQIIKQGSLSGGSSANTNIVAQIQGTILEIPVREGDQVIESNNFNAGTTIATIADMSLMIFEGKVDEAEVGKLKENTPLEITIGAINTKKFNADLTFIAPKGVDEQGAVMFKIKASLKLNDSINIRAGYSANAALILDKSENILAVKESLVQYDKETEKPYVEIEQTPQQFVRKDISLGLSDGINVEVTKGISKEDKIKVWNQVSGDPSNYSKN